MKAAALERVSLTAADADRLARFYVEAFGFGVTGRARADAARYGVAAGGALVLTLALGAQQIELVQFDQPGAAYPQPASSHDPWFQHIAIIVTDMEAAMRRLGEHAQPTPISLGGPATLPPSSGGVTAIKLRDPELHPFELLQFPAGSTPAPWLGGRGALGIDHSAIVVADSARSVAFYESIGLSVASRSLNQGREQEALDAAAGVRVEVTGLSPRQSTPHVELLCYRAPSAPAARIVGANDVAATRLVFRVEHPIGAGSLLLDPDGHRVMFRSPAADAAQASS